MSDAVIKPRKELKLTNAGELFKQEGMSENIYVNRTYDVMFDNINIGVIRRGVNYNADTGACNAYWRIDKDYTLYDASRISEIIGKRFTNKYEAADYILETYHQREFERLLEEPDVMFG